MATTTSKTYDLSATALVESKDQLVAYIQSGEKPNSDDWRIGSEHEKFVYHRSNGAPLSYEGENGRPGIRHILEGFVARGWQAVEENGHLIAAKGFGASLTLEPGGQFELSGAPLKTIHDTCRETTQHLEIAKEIGEELNIGFLGLGFHPTLKREDVPVMPKGRYDIMRRYMPKVGTMGLDMMLRTCTVQVNLDFASEADMVQKFRTSLALQPVATALFANSPFKENATNGFKSYRSHVWTDTDPDRCGMLPFVFEDGMGYERWVDHVLDVPMYFVRRGGKYIDAAGLSFRDFMAGNLSVLKGELPTMEDWMDHMTTVFPEVRLKTFLEMRGADAGPWSRLCALPALWVGLLYDADAQQAASDLVKDWTIEDMAELRRLAPRDGLSAVFKGQRMRDIAGEVVEIARKGLKARACLNSSGDDETHFINVLAESVRTGQTPADDLLACYAGKWKGHIGPVFDASAY